MLAVVKERPGPGYRLKDAAIPEPGPGQCLIKVEAVGICGTDIPILAGDRPVKLPLIPGHEFSGTVVTFGPDRPPFSNLKEGDMVTGSVVIECGCCHVCRQGHTSLCQEGDRLGITTHGAFAQYVALPVRSAIRLPGGLDHIHGASADAAASALRPLVRAFSLAPGQRMQAADGWPEQYRWTFIMGPGPIGLYALQQARALGATRVVVVGTRDEPLKIAEDLGASTVINNTAEDLRDRAMEVTGGEGANLVIEATGNPQALSQALSIAAPAGRIVLSGIFLQEVTIDPLRVVRGEMVVTGSLCYTPDEMRASLSYMASGAVVVEPVVTHTLPLRDFDRAMALIKDRKAVKVILRPWDDTAS